MKLQDIVIFHTKVKEYNSMCCAVKPNIFNLLYQLHQKHMQQLKGVTVQHKNFSESYFFSLVQTEGSRIKKANSLVFEKKTDQFATKYFLFGVPKIQNNVKVS